MALSLFLHLRPLHLNAIQIMVAISRVKTSPATARTAPITTMHTDPAGTLDRGCTTS
jgi:hypothetical protein